MIESANIYYIFDNENFDRYYGYIYLCILFPLLVAVFMSLVYLIAKDSPSTRALVPWSFLIASITAFILALWIIIYIAALYKKEKVFV